MRVSFAVIVLTGAIVLGISASGLAHADETGNQPHYPIILSKLLDIPTT